MFRFVLLSCLAVAASAALITPYGAFGAPIAYNAPLFAPYNYRGPLSLAPGQPANVLGADGRPLDTLDVNLDRSAHYTAKALDGSGIHLLKKRSVVSPLTYGYPLASSPIIAHSTPYLAPGPLTLSAPISHLSPLTYGAPLSHVW